MKKIICFILIFAHSCVHAQVSNSFFFGPGAGAGIVNGNYNIIVSDSAPKMPADTSYVFFFDPTEKWIINHYNAFVILSFLAEVFKYEPHLRTDDSFRRTISQSLNNCFTN